jgi:nucleoside-diphosphate-sugar epimerase
VARILVTGANGFIGSHVAARLARERHEVLALVRPTSSTALLEGVEACVVRGDVTDRASLDAAARNVDAVVHVAGFASDWGPWARFHAVNVEGTKNVAEAAAAAGAKRLVHVSSAVLHGLRGYRGADETAPIAKSGFPYNESKRLAEAWLFEFAKTTPLEVVAVRPGNVFGPKDHTFLGPYMDVLVAGKGGYVSGGRSFTCPAYVENLADAIERATFVPEANGEAFLVTDGHDVDWRTFTERLADLLGVKRPRLSVPLWLGYPLAGSMEGFFKLVRAKNPPLLTRYRILNGGRDYHFSIAKAKRVLGWTPRVGLDDALARSVAWYRAARAR